MQVRSCVIDTVTGELFVYYVLIALGGGVLMGVTVGLFEAIGIKIVETVMRGWGLPCGIVGATVVATWLVEAKQAVIENIAPVLTRVFAPLFALAFVAFIVTMAWTGRGFDVKREVLIFIDLLPVVVFGVLLYLASARDPLASPGLSDWIQLTLGGIALVVDLLALWAIVARISEFGFTPNRAAFSRLCRWQMFYLYVFAAWAGAVAFLFPLVFGFR